MKIEVTGDGIQIPITIPFKVREVSLQDPQIIIKKHINFLRYALYKRIKTCLSDVQKHTDNIVVVTVDYITYKTVRGEHTFSIRSYNNMIELLDYLNEDYPIYALDTFKSNHIRQLIKAISVHYNSDIHSSEHDNLMSILLTVFYNNHIN